MGLTTAAQRCRRTSHIDHHPALLAAGSDRS
jgi:hypothetical protein